MCHSRVIPRAVLFFSLALAQTQGMAASLQGSEWKPLRMGDVAVPDDSSAFVQFRSKGRLAGFSGCNRLFGEYEATSDGHLFIGPVAATRKRCVDSVMARESRLAAALENVRTFERSRHRLVLFDAARQPILEMRQSDWD